VSNEQYKVAQYGQWDGYPDGQGSKILSFLKEEYNKEQFQTNINQLTYITDEESKQRWIDCGADPDSTFVNMEVSNRFKTLYPENSRDAGGQILSIVQNANQPLKLENSIRFAEDSLFCEWAYVIDLDKNELEVFKGFNKTNLSDDERFYFLQENADENGYKPLKLLATFNLEQLPSEEDFLSALEELEEEEV
jgi:hypothetical protein